MMYSGAAGLRSSFSRRRADVHVHGADIALIVVAPHEVEQLLARVDLAGVAHEQLDEVKLLERQLHVLAEAVCTAALGVDLDVAAHELAAVRLGGRCGRHARAADERADARLELENVEGLGDVVVRTGFKADELGPHPRCGR